MNAAERINEGANKPAVGTIEIMQVEDEIASILTPDCVGSDCVLPSFMKNNWAADSGLKCPPVGVVLILGEVCVGSSGLVLITYMLQINRVRHQ
ncbi:hypothetical protein TNCV_3853581 [Trichonephila clavipes]|nr:hypothetical protein TNCV_3853581 [Trichonephila clavipes]